MYCLKDSGATLAVVNSRLVKEKRLPVNTSPSPLKVKLADNSTKAPTETVSVEVEFDHNYRYQTTAYVMDLGPSCDIMLGTPWLSSLGPHLADWERGSLAFRHKDKVTTLRSKKRPLLEATTINGIELISANQARHECRAWEKRLEKDDQFKPGFIFMQPTDISSDSSESNSDSESEIDFSAYPGTAESDSPKVDMVSPHE